MATIVEYHSLATIQIVIARNRAPSSRITKRLSARGKHLLLKCTLRSAGASIFQRVPSSLSSPRLHLTTGDERTWQALGERLIVPSSSRGRPRSATIAETELPSLVDLFSLSLFPSWKDKTDKGIFISFPIQSMPQKFSWHRKES